MNSDTQNPRVRARPQPSPWEQDLRELFTPSQFMQETHIFFLPQQRLNMCYLAVQTQLVAKVKPLCVATAS